LLAWDWVKIGFLTGVYAVIGFLENMKLGFKAAGTAIANFMGDMKANVLMILQNMINGAIDIINGFIDVLNNLPGVEIEAISKVTFGAAAQLENEAAKQARNSELNDYRNEVEAGAAERQAELDSMINDATNAFEDRLNEIERLKAPSGGVRAGAGAGTGVDFAGDQWEEITQNTADAAGNAGDTAGNTGKMADSMAMAEEDLKYMRDNMEEAAINRNYTTQIDVVMTNHNSVNSDMDIDGIINTLTERIETELVTTAEGVYV
jgi:hypothetical protein